MHCRRGAANSLDKGASGGHAVEYVAMEDLSLGGLLEAGLTYTSLCSFQIQQTIQPVTHS
jgi:hypothetical protein